jgi:CheY-like chemotaxis protein
MSVLEPVTDPVHGDPARLQQVVWNLVSNAVKFTPKGGRVQVVLARVNSSLELSVSDTGKGIDAQFLPHVFERFRQADSSAARDQGGLGLGLAIVKQLVELHGGGVRVMSEGRDKGSTFTVHLPLAAVQVDTSSAPKSHPKAVSLSSANLESPDLNGVRVLVVDDEPDARDLIERVLHECGASVVLASSAAEAIGYATTEPLDVILSDIGLPEKDGYELMRTLRERGCVVPAAALTAFARSEDRTRALNAGYMTHISKPVETAELMATVASLAHKTLTLKRKAQGTA